jgi:hypothetical protein
MASMLQPNSQRLDYCKKYSQIIARYNRGEERVTIEKTVAKLVNIAKSLDGE